MRHLNVLSLQQPLKAQSLIKRTRIKAYISTLTLASLLGTYLDLFLVGSQFYTFPTRPLKSIFPINIFFTLIILPILTACFLIMVQRLNNFKKVIFISISGVTATLMEQIAEIYGLFLHSQSWNHLYSFFGYMIYLIVIWGYFKWANKN